MQTATSTVTWMSAAAFVALWFVAAYCLARAYPLIKQHGRPSLRAALSLSSHRDRSHPAHRHVHCFLFACIFSLASWVIAATVGVSSGVFH